MKLLLPAEILTALSTKDLKKLELFLRSPYHNRNNDIIAFYNYYKKKDFVIPEQSLTEDLLKSIFRKPNMNKYRFNRLVSEFTELLNSFVLNEYFNSNKAERSFELMNLFKESKSLNNAQTAYEELLKELKNNTIIDNKFYYKNLKKEKFLNQLKFTEKVYSSKKEFQEINENIDLYFIFEKLQSFIMMIYHNKETSYKLDYDYTFREGIFDHIEKNESIIKKKHILIYMYYLVIKMLEETGSDHYFNIFRNYLFSNKDNISIGYFRELLMDYKNNCDNRVFTDQKKYGNEIYAVYKVMDEKGIFDIDKKISSNDFLNAIITALAIKKYSWAKYFYEKYKKYLDENSGDVIHLANANLNFHDNDHTGALLHLNNIRSKHFYYYLRVRLIRIKIYYELNENESVNYILDSVNHYIKRNKALIGINYMIVENFLKTVRKLLRLRNKYNSKEHNILKKYIYDEEGIYSKEWLLQKVNDRILSQ